MCILFMYVSNISKNLVKKDKSYKLILASNRDEKYSRPSATAKFWEEDETGEKHIFAGQDLEELGTWLGISRRGKLAVLLNIMGASSTTKGSNLISRGALVTGFLRSPADLPGCTYLNSLCHDPENFDISQAYNPFHLITVDILGSPKRPPTGAMCAKESNANLRDGDVDDSGNSQDDGNSSICVTYLSNKVADTSRQEPTNLTPPKNASHFYAVGNSPMDKPFEKVTCGSKLFENIVNEHVSKINEDEDTLVEKLLHFLKSTDRYFPDTNMEAQAKGTAVPSALLPYLSSIFVHVPGVDYGTRTHTVLLIDTENQVTFHEWTMKQPLDPSRPEWIYTKEMFKIDAKL